MKAENVLRWSVPSVLLIAGSAYAASPTLDGSRDTLYAGSKSAQQSSVIEIFSPPFAVELQTDNSNVGGVGGLAATNFKSEPGDVLTGFEAELSLGEIGWDGSSAIRIVAFVNNGGVNYLANQVAGGLNPAAPEGNGANIGSTPFNFDDTLGPAYAIGQQYVTVANVLGSATMTIDGIADEAEWSTAPPLYVNGIASPASNTENPTGFGDNNDPSVVTANGSEIDGLRAFRTANTLYLHIAGNIETNFNKFSIFFDTKAGGENIISGVPNFPFGGLGNMTNSQFDTTPANFAFDYYLQYGGDATNQYIDVADITLDTITFSGGDRGTNTPIVLASGLNGGAISCTVDNSNIDGITGLGGGDGVDVAAVSDPATVATGCEFSIDLDAIGWNGTDPINIAGFLADGDQMSNQVIGGIPNDSGILGPGDGVDFNTVPGNQYATISMAPAGTAPTIDGSTAGDSYTQLYVNNAGGTGNSTSFADATSGGGFDADPVGSEIDGLYATIANDGSGNKLYCVVTGNFGQYEKLGVFIDSQPGGQNTLRLDNPDVAGNFFNNLGGLVFDTGVAPDFAIVYNLGTNNGPDTMPGGGDDFVEHYVDAIELATNGAEDQPAGGNVGGGPKNATPISGDLVSRFGFGNNTLTDGVFGNGSELDNISAFVDSTYLWIFLGGNLETNFTKLEVFLDVIPYDQTSQTGGQNTLVYDEDPPTIEDPPMSGTYIPNPNYTGNPDIDFAALNRMGGPYPIPGTDPQEFQPGFTFDTGFTADYYLYATAGGDDSLFPGEPEWFGGIARLFDALRKDPNNAANPDPGTQHFWGGTSVSDGGEFFDTPGETAGLFIDNSNVLGVAGGPDQYEPDDSATSGVTTGVELRIPLAYILVNDTVNPDTNPPIQWNGQSNFKVTVFINGGFHSFASNQFLQPVCAGELGEPRLIDLEVDHPGLQYLEMVPHGVMTAYTNASAQPPDCIEPQGGCCVAQVCTENVLEGDCLTMGGTFLGDGTDCSGGCPAPEGACCLAGGNCAIFTQAICEGSGGTYQGDGTDCGSVSCPAGGACCYACPDGTTCTNVASLADCQLIGGLYAGDGTDCNTFNCGTLCRGDLDGDGDVDVFDFGAFAPNFGTISGASRCQGDMDCDGDVDVFDFGAFAPTFGCIGPATGSCP